MIEQSTLTFLAEMAANNNKPWFDANKEWYTSARTNVEGFVASVLQKLSVHDPVFETIDARKCVMRIYRDIRFSKDKTPYKTNFGAAFTPNGGKMNGAGFYIHIEPDKCFLGGGIWQPDGPALKAIRQEIDYNFSEFDNIIRAEAFSKLYPHIDGDKLKKAPQGYAEDNLAVEYLKLKSFTVSAYLTDKEILKQDAADTIVSACMVMRPFIDFLNRAVGR